MHMMEVGSTTRLNVIMDVCKVGLWKVLIKNERI